MTKITTFKSLRTIYVGPQGAHMAGRTSRYKLANPVRTALRTIPKSFGFCQENTRADAVRKAEVVISFGVKGGFGKPTLRLMGELSIATHSGMIRTFLHDNKARSVAIVLTDALPFWKIYKVIRAAFDWTKKDLNYLGKTNRQRIRELYATGNYTQNQLSERFGVSQPAIAYIVTGHTDIAHFRRIRKQGYVTMNALATETGTNWNDVARKANDLGITPVRTGPRTIMVRGEEKHRLKKALKRVKLSRDKEE